MATICIAHPHPNPMLEATADSVLNAIIVAKKFATITTKQDARIAIEAFLSLTEKSRFAAWKTSMGVNRTKKLQIVNEILNPTQRQKPNMRAQHVMAISRCQIENRFRAQP